MHVRPTPYASAICVRQNIFRRQPAWKKSLCLRRLAIIVAVPITTSLQAFGVIIASCRLTATTLDWLSTAAAGNRGKTSACQHLPGSSPTCLRASTPRVQLHRSRRRPDEPHNWQRIRMNSCNHMQVQSLIPAQHSVPEACPRSGPRGTRRASRFR